MPRIDVKTIEEGNYVYFENCVNYVASAGHCIKGYIGATNMYLPHDRSDHLKAIGLQIEHARSFFRKNNRRLGIHIVFTFSPEETSYLSRRTLLSIAYYIAETKFAGCMTYFAVHDNTELLHIDMLLISINMNTGNMYACSKQGWNKIALNLQSYLKTIMPEDAVGGIQVAYHD